MEKEKITPSISDGSNEALKQSGVVKMIEDILEGDYERLITSKQVYLSSALYLIYWYHRTKNNTKKHKQAKLNMFDYFGEQSNHLLQKLLDNEELKKVAYKHVEDSVLVMPTVDVVITSGDKLLTFKRDLFPKGPALVGGFVLDEDEDNNLGLSPVVFSALRVAGEKVIGGDLMYGEESGLFFVKGEKSGLRITLNKSSIIGHKYKDDVLRMVQPSDPRHMVDTTAFVLNLEGEIEKNDLDWLDLGNVLDINKKKGGLAFSHHRQLVSELVREEDESDKVKVSHHEWVRGIIKNG